MPASMYIDVRTTLCGSDLDEAMPALKYINWIEGFGSGHAELEGRVEDGRWDFVDMAAWARLGSGASCSSSS